jgi:hypothetical protein
MPIKFTAAWKLANGVGDDAVTPSLREIGAAFDNLLPLMLAGAGGAVGPAGLLVAQAIDSEDETGKLYLGRIDPSNLFVPLFVPAISAACQQLSTQLLSGTPPDPTLAFAAWSAQQSIAGKNLALDATMALYLGTAIIGGVGGTEDAPPPPRLPAPPVREPNLVTVITYSAVGRTANLTARVTGEGLVFAWRIKDASLVELAVLTGGPTVSYTAPYATTLVVELTVCNGGGVVTDSRNDVLVT